MPRFSFNPTVCDDDCIPMRRCGHCAAVDWLRGCGLVDDQILGLGRVSQTHAQVSSDEKRESPFLSLNLELRLINVLESNDIKTIPQLTGKTERELADLDGIVPKHIGEIKNALKTRNMHLREETIAELSFDSDLTRALERAEIKTVTKLTNRSERELLSIPGFEPRHLEKITEVLAARGLALRAPTPEGVNGERSEAARSMAN